MDKKERRDLIIFSLYFSCSILIVIGTMFRRTLGALKDIYILNVGMDIIGMVMCAILFSSCMLDSQKTRSDVGTFIKLLVMTFTCQFLDAMAWLVDGVPALRMVNVVDNTLYYMCAPCQAYLFWRYIKLFFHVDRRSAEIVDKAVRWGALAALALCVVNLFAGFYFSVDSGGVYHRSDFHMLSYIYVYFTLIAAFALIVLERRQIPRYKALTLLSYVLTAAAAEILTMNIYGLSIAPTILTSVILVMYCVLNVDQGRKQAIAERDLRMATRIQQAGLPTVFPAFPERDDFDIYASMTPAKEVGGDFYDFFLLDDDHLAMIIADVSGKGVPAALFMMSFVILIKNTLKMEGPEASPGKVLGKINNTVCAKNTENMFVTVWVGIMTISTGTIRAANAGHEYPIIRKANESFKTIKDRHGLAVGALEGVSYRDYEIVLEKGDVLFLYTDGVAEAANAANNLFGMERTLQALNSAGDVRLKGLLEHMKESIDKFTGNAPQFDDITMLAVTRY